MTFTDNDDFVVDVPITDEYRVAYRQYSLVSRIRHQFIRNFISGDVSVLKLFEKTSAKQESKEDLSSSSNDDTQIKPRKATTEEKRFERFVKHKIKGMLNDKYVEIIEAEHYLGIIAVILDIFNKYSNIDYVEDIFTNDYVLETRIQLFSKLISKQFEESEEFGDLKEIIITKCLSIILENHVMAINSTSLEESSDIENKNKRFLMLLEKQNSLRENYKHYIKKAIDNGESTVCTLGHTTACKYIENLYGYKTQEQLICYIREKYPDADVDFKEKTLRISVKTESLKDYNNPSTDVLKEISRYSTQISRIDYVYIDIENIADIPENKNTRIKIQHNINMQYRKWQLTEEWKNGMTDVIKARYISF